MHVDLRGKRGECPQNVECGGGADAEEGEHAAAAGYVGLEEKNAEREQKWEQSLGIEHEGGAHVVSYGG